MAGLRLSRKRKARPVSPEENAALAKAAEVQIARDQKVRQRTAEKGAERIEQREQRRVDA